MEYSVPYNCMAWLCFEGFGFIGYWIIVTEHRSWTKIYPQDSVPVISCLQILLLRPTTVILSPINPDDLTIGSLNPKEPLVFLGVATEGTWCSHQPFYLLRFRTFFWIFTSVLWHPFQATPSWYVVRQMMAVLLMLLWQYMLHNRPKKFGHASCLFKYI